MKWLDYTSVSETEPDQLGFRNLSTLEPVLGVATSRGSLLTVESTALVFTGFPIVGTVVNLELELVVDRAARIQDKVIQLWIGGAAYGDNLADLSAANRHVYSWHSLNLDWQSDYGVVVDLQPHTQYPSNNLVTIRSVRLRTVS